MKRTHVFDWSERGEAADMKCRKCGQAYLTHRGTDRCVCWKMRLPKRKEK